MTHSENLLIPCLDSLKMVRNVGFAQLGPDIFMVFHTGARNEENTDMRWLPSTGVQVSFFFSWAGVWKALMC